MTNTTTTGTKYSQDQDLADVAKLIRKDLKAAGFKASVRISRYSMGQSLNVEIKALPKSADLSSAVVWQGYPKGSSSTTYAPYTGPDCIGEAGWFRPAAPKATVEAIVATYNRETRSDQPDDYYNCDFYAHVDYSRELSDLATAAAIKTLTPSPKTAPKPNKSALRIVSESKAAQVELMELLEAL